MLRPKLNRVWTSNNANLRRDPGDAKYLQGWIAEIPTFQVLNYLQYKVDTTLLALAERGVFEWGTDVQYGLGSLVWDDATQTVYVATVGSPSRTLRPSQNLGQWAASAIQVSRYDYDDIVSKISAHIADVTSNPHRLTANMIGAYNKAQIDSLVAQYNALVASHANDRDNPHKVTAVQAGAVPTTGGTYTGPVTFQQGMLFDASGTTKLSFGPDGFYMQSGDTRIGLDASGVPVVGNGSTNTNSRIITDATFAEVKAREEPKYAAPLESFQMGLINSINIQRGTGTASTTGEPTYDLSTGMMGVNNVEFRLAASDVMQLPSNTAFTICFDYLHTFIPGESAWSIVVGMDFARVLVRKSGAMFIYINPTQMAYASTTIPAALSGTIIRIAGSYDGTTYRLYINGVLVASQAGAPPAGGSKPSIYIPKWPDTVRIKNFRLWPSALTAKQISTL